MPILPVDSKSKQKELRKQLSELEAIWDSKREALVKPTMAQSDEFWSERRDALGPLQEEIQYQLSAQLIAQANRYQVPVPAFVEDGGPWTEPEYISPFFLNEVARAELRTAIRKEQKERSEILRTWLTVILGLIGAVCGVAALLIKK
jgi:DNA repair exonuclease SbcCD ATPase subunit